jgi:fatty acid desaturase
MTTSDTPVALDVSHYLNQRKPLWNAIAISYAILGYVGRLFLLTVENLGLNGLGVVILSHALIIAAYLSHEFMHSTIFVGRPMNALFGNVMLWLTGSCYARFDDLARMHIAHHVNRVDYWRFNLSAYLTGMPAIARRLVLALEWAYIPALAVLLRIRSMLAPWWDADRKTERGRNLFIFAIRGSAFLTLAIYSPKAAVLYVVAYMAMLNVLRFIDAFQHTYEALPMNVPLPKRDRAYEQANTFSNLVSIRQGWLNLLFLNFGYHNAHHELMKCPWHSLAELDRDLFSGEEPHYITLGQLIKNYHQFRLTRIHLGQGRAVDDAGQQDISHFYGAIEVSFLVYPS